MEANYIHKDTLTATYYFVILESVNKTSEK